MSAMRPPELCVNKGLRQNSIGVDFYGGTVKLRTGYYLIIKTEEKVQENATVWRINARENNPYQVFS